MPRLDVEPGVAHLKRGDCAKAAAFFANILKTDPVHADSLNWLAIARLGLNQTGEALDLFEKALALSPGNPLYLNNYGVALMREGLPHAAKNAFAAALAARPGNADAWTNLGAARMLLEEDPREVEANLQQALALDADHPDALARLADLRLAENRRREAAAILARLAELRPAEAATFRRRAAEAMAAAGDHAAAAGLAGQAAALDDADAELHKFYGECLGEDGDVAGARDRLRRAAAMPGGKPVWRWKHLGYCPVFFETAGEIDDYWEGLNRDLDAALAEAPRYDWRTLVRDGFASSFQLPHHNRCCREAREKFAALFAPSFPFAPSETPAARRGDGRFRVGFLVTPGQEVGFLRAMRGIVAGLDPSRFEAVALHRRAVAPLFAGLPALPYADDFAGAVADVRAAGCDLIHHWKAGEDVWSAFFPPCRPAPIQSTAWGTHGTSGIPWIDYYLSWDAAESASADSHYCEKLVRLACPPATEPERPPPVNATRRALGLPSGVTLYFCPHRLQKYHPDFDFHLRDILDADSSAMAMLLMGGEPGAAGRIRDRLFRTLGAGIFRRLIFLPALSPERYYRHVAVSDVMLDAPYYAGEFTGRDALALGVPCVTREGGLLVQRYTAARHRTMGLEELIASDREGYVRIALRLGRDAAYREDVSSRIAARRDAAGGSGDAVGEYERFFEAAASRTPIADHGSA